MTKQNNTNTIQNKLSTKATSHEGQCIPAAYCHAHMLLSFTENSGVQIDA